MDEDLLRFTVTRLSATVPEGVPITWRGREFASGPLTIELAARDPGTANQGVLDYTTRRARAEFHVRLSFPQFAETLRRSRRGSRALEAGGSRAALRRGHSRRPWLRAERHLRPRAPRPPARRDDERRGAARTLTSGRGLPVGSPDPRRAAARRIRLVAVHARSEAPLDHAAGRARGRAPRGVSHRRLYVHPGRPHRRGRLTRTSMSPRRPDLFS